MEKLGVALAILLGGAGLLFLAIILGTFLGAVGGWTIGLVFGDTILGFLAALGIHGVTMWQVGASLGFMGSYFKTHSITSST